MSGTPVPDRLPTPEEIRVELGRSQNYLQHIEARMTGPQLALAQRVFEEKLARARALKLQQKQQAIRPGGWSGSKL